MSKKWNETKARHWVISSEPVSGWLQKFVLVDGGGYMSVHCLITPFMFPSHKYCLTFQYRARPTYKGREKQRATTGELGRKEEKYWYSRIYVNPFSFELYLPKCHKYILFPLFGWKDIRKPKPRWKMWLFSQKLLSVLIGLLVRLCCVVVCVCVRACLCVCFTTQLTHPNNSSCLPVAVKCPVCQCSS